jgi:hypothetical protein
MERKEHVHIISAGEKIHIAYPALFRTLPTITRTYVFSDSEVYALSPDPGIEKERLAIRHAVDTVKEISTSLSIPCSRETIFPPAYPSVRDALTKIRLEFPGARFTFDLSGGSKELCTALLAYALWLGGDVYSSFDEKVPRRVPLPDRSFGSLLSNPNYQTILAILIRQGKSGGEAPGHSWVSRQYLYQQLWPLYAPSRTKSTKPDDPPAPVVHYQRGRKPAAELTQATFSGFMATLREAGLVDEDLAPESRKEKVYWVTGSGEIAFRLFADPATNTLVNSVLNGK